MGGGNIAVEVDQISRAQELNGDWGWVQHRAQEEGDRLWTREWNQQQAILIWHTEALDLKARHGVLSQGKI